MCINIRNKLSQLIRGNPKNTCKAFMHIAYRIDFFPEKSTPILRINNIAIIICYMTRICQYLRYSTPVRRHACHSSYGISKCIISSRYATGHEIDEFSIFNNSFRACFRLIYLLPVITNCRFPYFQSGVFVAFFRIYE